MAYTPKLYVNTPAMQMFNTIASRYRSRIKQGSFGHNVLLMFAGTAIGQFGAVLLSPVLTRIYTPDMFGVLGIFSAAIYIASVIASLRYEMALPLAQSDEEAANMLGVCILALIGTTLISCIVVTVITHFGGDTVSLGQLAPYRWLLPFGFFCIGAYQVLVYYATQQVKFGVIARTKIYQGSVGPLSQIGMGLAGAGTWGLIIGFILGQSTGITLLFSRLVLATHAIPKMSGAGIKTLARRYCRFPLISSWSALLEAAGGTYFLLLAIPLLYSNAIGGFIFLTDRVIGRPLLLVSTSILQVYLGDMSRSLTLDPEAVRKRFLQLAGHQFLIVAGWLLLVNILAPYLFPLVFGQEWQEAVPYLHVLSIAYLAQMVMHALVHTLQIMERQLLSAAWETGRLIAVATAFFVSRAMGFSALEALLAYSIVQALAQIVLFILMYRSILSLQRKTDA